MTERNPLVQILAANLSHFMQLRGLNAASLARAADLNATGVHDIMSGKSRSPRLDTVAKLASALNVPVSQLLERSEDHELWAEITAIFSRLSPVERRRLIQAAAAWLSGASPSA